MSGNGWGISSPGDRRFYVYSEEAERRYWLDARTLDDAIDEARDLDNTVVGQSVDIYDHKTGDEVAVMVDVEG